jgi:hypothetical protein
MNNIYTLKWCIKEKIDGEGLWYYYPYGDYALTGYCALKKIVRTVSINLSSTPINFLVHIHKGSDYS